MFELGFGEILLILVCIILFVDPKKLPQFLYQVGLLYGKITKYYREMNNALITYQRDIEKQKRELAEKTKNVLSIEEHQKEEKIENDEESK